MSLRNLLGTSLEQITPDRDFVGRLLEAARRQIEDAKVTAVSTETRFSSAYSALIRLDKLRKQRNLTEYTGDIIPESALAECLACAEELHAVAWEWLRKNAPDLL